MRIEGLSWDERAEEHISRHGISIEEVEESIQNIGYARKSRGYLVALCQTEAGRYLTLVLDDEGDGFWYPVTAYPMRNSERRLLIRQKIGRFK